MKFENYLYQRLLDRLDFAFEKEAELLNLLLFYFFLEMDLEELDDLYSDLAIISINSPFL